MDAAVAALLVEAEVRRLISTYALSMDSRDIETCSGLFFDDAVLAVNGEEQVGGAAIRTWMDALAASPPGRHMTANTVVDAVGERATATSDLAFLRPADAGGWQVMVSGRYRDVVERRDGRWGFQRRDIDLR